MGEVASQALIYALKKIAEEIAQDPQVEKIAASLSIDVPKKTYAQQKRGIPSTPIVIKNQPRVNVE